MSHNNIYISAISEEIACADPSRCKEICDSESGCSNIAYPLLVIRILPIGECLIVSKDELYTGTRRK